MLALTDPADDTVRLLPVAGGEPRKVEGIERHEVALRWSADGASLFLAEPDTLPMRVMKLELATGKRDRVRELAPGDPAGVTRLANVAFTPDGRSWIMSYGRTLSTLFVATGLR